MGTRRVVASVVVAALMTTSVAACARQSGGEAAEVTGGFTGDVSVEETDLTAPAAEVEGVEALSPVLEVTTDGEVTGEVEIAIPLDEEAAGSISDDSVVFALTAQHAEGPWDVVPAEIEGDTVVVTTTHLSLFQAFTSLLGAIGDVARDTLEGITSDAVAEADAPSCDDEDGVRSAGYEVTSDDGDTVFWCLGQDDQGAYLTVVNNRRYTLLLSHGDGLIVGDQTGDGEEVHELLTSALALDNQVSIGPRESVTFRVEVSEGGHAAVTTKLDGVGAGLYQLDAGIDTLISILSRFGAKDPDDGLAAFLDDAGCVESVASANAGTILAGCFDYDTIRAAWGSGTAALLAPVIAAGSLISFFQTQLNTLGDQINGRDRYAMTVSRGGSASESGGSALLLGASFESTSTLWSVTAAGDEQLATVTDGASGFGVELTDVAVVPDGTLYGVGFDSLYRLDPATGLATPVGVLGVGSVNALVAAPDGRLLAADNAGALVEVDPTNGAATPIGSFGALVSSGDLAFGPDGTLYAATADGSTGAGVLATVDPATGVATAVLDLPFPEVYGLAFSGGDLYGLTTATGTSCPLGALVRIDVAGGVTEQLRCVAFPPGGASPP